VCSFSAWVSMSDLASVFAASRIFDWVLPPLLPSRARGTLRLVEADSGVVLFRESTQVRFPTLVLPPLRPDPRPQFDMI